MSAAVAPPAPVARARGLELRYGEVRALDAVDLDIPAGVMAGFIGPDGVGKSSLLALVAGARALQAGSLSVLDGDMARARHRRAVCTRIAYMPQGLGRNLAPTLSVFENLDFFARLFGRGRADRARRIAALLDATGLAPFSGRAAGKLSGGMRQKLGLCCALIHDPDLLILDEPTTGVDPLSRRQFWDLIGRIRAGRRGMSVLVATAYMEEAARFDWLAVMNGGRVLDCGSPQELLERTGADRLESAYVALLPEAQRIGHVPVTVAPRAADPRGEAAIEARDLTVRFGDFTAVDGVNFRIDRGEIFGFLGSNGCGKTTTMKVLTGLLPASSGEVRVFGRPLDGTDLDSRRRVGYMTQSFSLYGELTVRQNLVLHARLFGVSAARIPGRVAAMAARFGLDSLMDALPGALPLGQRQRLSLAVAMIHQPELLILDEPTSGVDPVARDAFWRAMLELSRRDNVTIFISTHFMSEAERCDRISFMDAGRVLASDTPEALMRRWGAASLEQAFVACLESAGARTGEPAAADAIHAPDGAGLTGGTVSGEERAAARPRQRPPGLRRLLSYARRETLELLRDPVRLILAGLGSALLMLVLGYGISMDVEDLSFAVLDRDQTPLSRDYALNLAGSRYFIERAPIRDPADLDARMRSGELSLAIEIPADFARNLGRGGGAQVGAWVDGAMPTRAETARGYVQGAHQHWLAARAREAGLDPSAVVPATVEVRFRYNPDVRSLVAMVPAVIPLLLMLIPAMLTALSVVREKELGSIVNFYVTPVTRLEFLLGKQLPYLVLGMASYALLVVMAVMLFGVPLKGSLTTLTAAAALYVACATALGLVMSSFMRSQIAALFGTAVLTLVPATQFSGLIDPVTSLEGLGRWIGEAYPTTHFLTVARGVFSKQLALSDLGVEFISLAVAAPLLMLLGAALLSKQER